INVDWRNFLNKCQPYDRQAYNQLERLFRSLGDEREAGNVYLTRRKREIRQSERRVFGRFLTQPLSWEPIRRYSRKFELTFFRVRPSPRVKQQTGRIAARILQAASETSRLAFHTLQWCLFRFGVRPLRLLVMSLVIIGFGCIVFSQPGAVTQKEV